MDIISKEANKRHIRSASYPPAQTNHKHVLKLMEQQIHDLQKLEASSTSPIETLRIGFSGLASLYKLCLAHDGVLLFHVPHQQPQQQPFLNVDSLCSSSRELVLTFKQGLSNLLVAASNPDADPDYLVSTYLSLRKQTTRSAREIASILRHLETSLVSSYNDGTSNNNNNNNESHMKKMLDCVSIINISVLDSLLRLLALPLSKLNKKRSCLFNLSIISKFRMRIKPQGSRDEVDEINKMGNEIYNLDVALNSVLISNDTVSNTGLVVVCQRLEVLEKGFKGIEDGLANIVSHLSILRSHLFN